MSLTRGSHSNRGSQSSGWEPFSLSADLIFLSAGSLDAPPPQAGPHDQVLSEVCKSLNGSGSHSPARALSISGSSGFTARRYGLAMPPQGDFYRYGCNVNFRYYYACFPTQKS